VHNALERYYGYGEALLPAYDRIAREELERLTMSGIRFYESTWRKEADLGRIMLAGYETWLEETGADADIRVVSAEEKLCHMFEIDGTPVELRGKIDLRAFNTFTEQYLVVDFKTCKSFESLTESAHLSSQLLTYMLLEKLNAVGDPDHHLGGAMYVMFRKVRQGSMSKPPFYARHEVHHNTDRIRTHYHQTVGLLQDYVRVVKALDAGTDWRLVAYPNPHPFTRYSDFKTAMDMIGEPGLEVMLHDRYKQHDPHARYAESPVDMLAEIA
jgi:hypothetical protein